MSSASQKTNASPSKSLREISKLQLPIGLIHNLSEFQARFLNNSVLRSSFTLIFFFEDFPSAYTSLLKYHSSIVKNSEAVEFFYCLENSDFEQLKRPFFVAFQGQNRFMEMRLNLSEEDFEEILQKVQRIEENSNEDSALNHSEQGDYLSPAELDEKRGAFLEFLKNMRDDGEVTEVQYYYLKCLYLENNAKLLQAIYNSLE